MDVKTILHTLSALLKTREILEILSTPANITIATSCFV